MVCKTEQEMRQMREEIEEAKKERKITSLSQGIFQRIPSKKEVTSHNLKQNIKQYEKGFPKYRKSFFVQVKRKKYRSMKNELHPQSRTEL